MSDDNDANVEPARRPSLLSRQYIVDKAFQYRLINRLLVVWMANTIFFAMILYFLYQWHIKEFYTLVPKDGIFPLLSVDELLLTAVGFVGVFGFVVIGILGAYLTNQIAGPLYRVKMYLERIGTGDFSFEVRFRKGDFLQDIPAIFNRALEGLRGITQSDLDKLQAIGGSIEGDAPAHELLSELRQKKRDQLQGDTAAGNETSGEAVSVH